MVVLGEVVQISEAAIILARHHRCPFATNLVFWVDSSAAPDCAGRLGKEREWRLFRGM